jgi:uncharacterized SAM-binding protein YcdF (DUF218 family)
VLLKWALGLVGMLVVVVVMLVVWLVVEALRAGFWLIPIIFGIVVIVIYNGRSIYPIETYSE